MEVRGSNGAFYKVPLRGGVAARPGRRGLRGGRPPGGIRARPGAGGRWRPWGEPLRRAAEEGRARGKGAGGRCLGVAGAVGLAGRSGRRGPRREVAGGRPRALTGGRCAGEGARGEQLRSGGVITLRWGRDGRPWGLFLERVGASGGMG